MLEQPTGERNIGIGGDVSGGSMVSGNQNVVGDGNVRQSVNALHGTIQNVVQVAGDAIFNLYTQAPTLGRQIRAREFRALVAERTRNFVGRDFVFTAIDRLLNDSDFPCGYIVISGEPGIGKTALMAQMVKQNGLAHHFNIALQNIRSIRDFLTNLCAQLIVRYQLSHPDLPEDAGRDSGFLNELLAEAAAQQTGQGKKVVILVDALDEADDAGLAPEANRLYLPGTLPEGVFFIVTTREQAEYRLLVDQRQDIYLRDDDPANLADVRQYIANFFERNREGLAGCLQQWQVDEAEFSRVITEKSQGNFMYLVHVLRDIKDGTLTAANLDNIRKLPLGLREYYQRHWRTMRSQNQEKFEQVQQKVVCMLATVAEAVTVDSVAEWTKLEPTVVKEVIAEWREFLNADEREDGEPLYRVYHASFKDFLKEEVGLKAYHQVIAEHALNKIKW